MALMSADDLCSFCATLRYIAYSSASSAGNLCFKMRHPCDLYFSFIL